MDRKEKGFVTKQEKRFIFFFLFFRQKKMTDNHSPYTVVIIGGGLVGSLAAVTFAKKGWNVELYELRKGKTFFLKKK